MHAMICGGRTQSLTPAMTAWLDELRQTLSITVLIPGGSRHLDSALTTWAHMQGVPVAPIPADWQPGHAHGAVRSGVYLDLLTQYSTAGLALLALPGGEGTQYLVTLARRLGLPVYLYEEEPMPEMTAPHAPEESPVPMLDDDIPDVKVPETLVKTLQDAPGGTEEAGSTEPQPLTPAWQQHEALLQGFLGHVSHKLNEEVLSQSKDILDVVKGAIRFIDEAAQRQSLYQDNLLGVLANALTGLQGQGLQLRHDPYTAEVQALAPQGFAVTLTVKKQDTSDLIATLQGLMQWLAQEGYKPVV